MRSTTILIRPGAWTPVVDGSRALADTIPNSEIVEISGADMYPNGGDVDELVHALGAAMGAALVRSGGPALLTLLFSFTARGRHELKGLMTEQELFALDAE